MEVASEDVLDTMIDEVILGFCFDIHRLLKKGKPTISKFSHQSCEDWGLGSFTANG